jgi:hypothetical protein
MMNIVDNERTIADIWNQRLTDIGEEPMPELDLGEDKCEKENQYE